MVASTFARISGYVSMSSVVTLAFELQRLKHVIAPLHARLAQMPNSTFGSCCQFGEHMSKRGQWNDIPRRDIKGCPARLASFLAFGKMVVWSGPKWLLLDLMLE